MQHRLDKVVLDVVTADGSVFQYQAGVTICDVDAKAAGTYRAKGTVHDSRNHVARSFYDG